MLDTLIHPKVKAPATSLCHMRMSCRETARQVQPRRCKIDALADMAALATHLVRKPAHGVLQGDWCPNLPDLVSGRVCVVLRQDVRYQSLLMGSSMKQRGAGPERADMEAFALKGP